MKNRHLSQIGALAVSLATVLGMSTAYSAEVNLQAEQFQKTVPYGSGAPSRSISVANASFEGPDCDLGGTDCPNSSYTSGIVAGWTVTGAAGVFDINENGGAIITATDGDQVAFSNGGTISQVLAETVAAGMTYTLTVDVGDRGNTNFPGYTVALYAGDVQLGADSSLVLASEWGSSVVSYTVEVGDPQLGQPLEIRLQSAGAQTEFDNVRLEAAQTAAIVTMWGYSECNADFTVCGAPSSPGPQLTVAAGDASGLTVNLRNTLPEPTSIMIAGQMNAPLSDPASVRNAAGALTSFVDVVPAAVPGTITNVAVANSSFENPDCDLGGTDCPNGSYTSGIVAGWTVSGGGAGVFDINENGPAVIMATDGDQVAYSNGGLISQTLVETLTAGITYTLSVDVGDRDNTNFPGYSVALYAGGVELSADSALNLSSEWGTSVVTYTATAGDPQLGQALEIRLQSNGSQTEFDNVRLTADAGDGSISTGVYTWPNLRPGTYLYHSGSHVQLQVHMGLYGAMVQDDTCDTGLTAPCAYPDVPYASQEVLVFSEIDPALHDPVPLPANATVNGYVPQFFLINGEPYDGIPPAASGAADTSILLRLINAGLDNRSLQMIGGYFTEVAEDGRRLPTTKEKFSTLLPAAKSMDVILNAPAGTYPLFDRRGKLVNGPVHGGGLLRPIIVE